MVWNYLSFPSKQTSIQEMGSVQSHGEEKENPKPSLIRLLDRKER